MRERSVGCGGQGSTIHINGSTENDTIDITGLSSAHRVVFVGNGGADTVIGTPRPQDLFGHDRFGMGDDLDARTGICSPDGRGPALELGRFAVDDTIDPNVLQAMFDQPDLARTMLDTSFDLHPLEPATDIAALQLTQDALGHAHSLIPDPRIIPAEVDNLLG